MTVLVVEIMALLALNQLVSHGHCHLSADHTSQAHFHGKVISIGLIIVIYVWQKVFARLNGNW